MQHVLLSTVMNYMFSHLSNFSDEIIQLFGILNNPGTLFVDPKLEDQGIHCQLFRAVWAYPEIEKKKKI